MAAGNIGMLQMCVNVMDTFNRHMRQMYNDTRADGDSIMSPD
jgi:hypothetical protein